MKLYASLFVALSLLLNNIGVDAGKIIANSDPIKDSYIVVFLDDDQFPVEEKIRMIKEKNPNIRVEGILEKSIQGFVAKMSADEAESIKEYDFINFIEQDGRVSINAVDTWGIDRIDQTDLPLDNSYTPYGHGAGVTTYILDTGILTSHEEFDTGRAFWGANFVGDGINTDCHGHGTHVAATAVGKNYGVANQADTVAVKVLGCSGYGTWAGVIQGVEWVMNNADHPATANMSLGGGSHTALNTAVNNLHNSGVPVVVAAGNNDSNACNYSPAGASDVITVASSDDDDSRSYFSNYGSCVEIFAPGRSIKSAWIPNDTDYNTISGTSMASPHVCGAAALLLEDGVDPADVLTELEDMATPNKITDVMGSPNLLVYVGHREEKCLDSKAYFQWNGGLRNCKFYVKNNPSTCDDVEIKRLCPKTCKECERYGCVDATWGFQTSKKALKSFTCELIANMPWKRKVKLCQNERIHSTCRNTCQACGCMKFQRLIIKPREE